MKYLNKLLKILNSIRRRLFTFFWKFRFAQCGRKFRCDPFSSFFTFDNIYIGNNVSINSMAYFSSTHGKIIIGDDVMFGPGVVLVGGNHLVEDKYTKMIDILKGKDHDDGFLTIKNNVWIGANVVIMPNVTIETGCIIGANAVVTDSTVPYGIYGGVPAKLIKIRK